MELELGTGKVVDYLSEERIGHALSRLPGGDDSFAILTKDKNHFMQTHGSALDGFVLEYQDGSLDSHYRCVDDNLELSAIQRTFQLYFKGDDRWRTEYEWQPVDLSNP